VSWLIIADNMAHGARYTYIRLLPTQLFVLIFAGDPPTSPPTEPPVPATIANPPKEEPKDLLVTPKQEVIDPPVEVKSEAKPEENNFSPDIAGVKAEPRIRDTERKPSPADAFKGKMTQQSPGRTVNNATTSNKSPIGILATFDTVHAYRLE